MTDGAPPKSVAEFAEVARAICDGLDRGLIGTTHDLGLQLVRLQLCAMRLPAVTAPHGGVSQPPPPTPHLDLSWLPDDVYWDVFDPFAVVPDEPVAISLVDNLAGMHCELTRGLILYDAGQIDAAWWEWRTAFYAHWGEHLLGAQRALFALGRG